MRKGVSKRAGASSPEYQDLRAMGRYALDAEVERCRREWDESRGRNRGAGRRLHAAAQEIYDRERLVLGRACA